DKLNAALADHPDLQALAVDDLLRGLGRVPENIRTAVRNHGGGHANHALLWPLLKKGTKFGGPVAEAITQKFGGFAQFKELFGNAAKNQFGSGWAWLVLGPNGLEVTATPNQDSPLVNGATPIVGIDVWEHAYYLKYQNRRPDYVEAFFEVLNWDQANRNYENAKK
ncbi:MAG TPA: superoxide dismutase, partial [candidate division Zixibacteria bacterium]|nr:superoxide dismutase [candidate division Zixibacteria bacterium]